MTFHLLHQTCANNNAQSPFRIIEQQTGREVAWINRFLDRECVRRLADTTLRSYALDLMYFVRWWASVHQTDAITEDAIAGSTLLDYVRFQSGQKPRPAAAYSLSNAHCRTSFRTFPASLHQAFKRSIGKDPN